MKSLHPIVGLTALFALGLPLRPAAAANSLEFAQDLYEVTETSERRVSISLHRIQSDAAEIRFRLRVIGGEAGDSDYTLGCEVTVDNACQLNPDAPAVAFLWPWDDGVPESDESLLLELDVLAGAEPGPRRRARVILHDGPQTLDAVSGGTAREGRDATLILQVARSGDRSQPCSVEYRTLADGTATPGMDYLPQTGTVRFAANEQFKEIPVPILNDGLVEGMPESVRFELFNPSPGVAIRQGVGESYLLDDEVPATLDFNFRPAVWADAISVQPDGKILVFPGLQRESRTGSRESAMARMYPNGSLDREFYVDANIVPGEPARLALAPDGGIVISGSFDQVDGVPRRGLARLQPNGRLDRTFLPADVAALTWIEDGPKHVAVLRSGRVLLSHPWDSSRLEIALRADGSLDTGFTQNAVLALEPFTKQSQFKELSDGRLLCVVGTGSGEALTQSLIVFRDDGTLDPAFPGISVTGLSGVLPLSDGRIAIAYSHGARPLAAATNQGGTLTYLTLQGKVEKSVPLPAANLGYPLLELNGRIYWATTTSFGGNRGWIQRLNADGTLDRDFAAPALQPIDSLSGYLRVFAAAHQDGLLCWTFPPLTHPLYNSGYASIGPFRVLTKNIPPSRFDWATAPSLSGPSLIRERDPFAEVIVQRLGDTSGDATVNFATRDGRAHAGINYVASQGTLHFAPMEIKRTIRIPLIDNILFQGAPEFLVDLKQPSDSAAALAPPLSVPIHDDEPGIIPETFRLTLEGSTQFTLTLAPGVQHVLERSSDLRDWLQVASYLGDGIPRTETLDQPSGGAWFYRVRRQ